MDDDNKLMWCMNYDYLNAKTVSIYKQRNTINDVFFSKLLWKAQHRELMVTKSLVDNVLGTR